jgi:hypothetical protein
MTTVTDIARLAALMCAAALCMSGVRLLDALEAETRTREAVTRELPRVLHREAELIRRDLQGELEATRATLDGRLASIESTADARLASIQSEVVPLAAGVAADASNAVREYQRIPAVIGARLDHWTNCVGNGNCWQSQVTATLGATRATMGAVAKAAPGIAGAMDRSAASTEKATSATADAMRNIAEVSRPLPRWVRVPLQILGPTTPIWLPFTIR